MSGERETSFTICTDQITLVLDYHDIVGVTGDKGTVILHYSSWCSKIILSPGVMIDYDPEPGSTLQNIQDWVTENICKRWEHEQERSGGITLQRV